MDPVPAYLLAYFLRIRKHAGEPGYMKQRLERADLSRAVNEKSMLRELLDLHLIGVSSKEDEVVFNPLTEEVAPGFVVHRSGTEHRVRVPNSFIVLARGRYIWTELLFSAALWLLASALGAVIGTLVTLRLGQRP